MFILLSHVFRGISTMFALLFAVISVGLSHVEEASVQSMLPAGGIAMEPVATDEVHILQNQADISYKLQQAIDIYSQRFPNQTPFSVQTIASETDYRSTLRSRLLSGDDVDLFMISGARELVSLQENIAALDFLTWASGADYGSADAVTQNGKIFGVPYCIEAFGFICNRNVFEAAGVPLDDIRSFEDLSGAFTEIRDKINAGEFDEDFAGIKAVCDFPARDKAFLGGEFADIALTGTFASNAEAASAESVTFSAAAPVEELVKLIARFSANSREWTKLAEITNDAQIERFAKGNTAAILGNTNVYRRVNELNPKLQGRLYLMPIPLENFEQASIYAGVPAYWAINAASGEKIIQAAGDFLTWLYRSDEGTRYFAEEFEQTSPYRDTAKETGATLHSQMLNYLRAGMYLPQIHAEFPENWGRDVFAPNIQTYFTDREKTWPEVIKSVEEGWHG